MKFLFDFLPVVFFFIAYKFFGDLPPAIIDLGNQIPGVSLSQDNPKHAIIFATLIIIIATILQNILHWFAYKKFEKMHLISLVILIVFGSMTVVSRDPDFIKWKVSIFNWIFASVLFGSLYIGKKPLIERMMSHAISVPSNIWRKLTYSWGAFFIFIGILNYIVAFHYAGLDDKNWVNFKLFGILGLTFVFMISQGFYLAKHATNTDKESTEDGSNDNDAINEKTTDKKEF
jgi:intracellular septation protein